MSRSPIFIVSSERSGSNLLRTLLDNHSQLRGPRAPHLLKSFSERHHLYRPLSNPNNAKELLNDMISIANFSLYDWRLDVSGEEIYSKHKPSCLLSCFHAVYSTQTDELRFVCKENNLFDFVNQLWRYYDEPKFIYLYRDPRDYVPSRLKVPMLFDTPLDAARNWAREQSACLKEFRTFELPAHFISYEELIQDTPARMREVLEFVGEEAEDSCFQVDTGKNENVSSNPFWKNLSKQVDSQNQKKYRQQLSKQDIEVVETVAQKQMRQLGYELETPASWKRTKLFGVQNRLRKRRQSKKLVEAHPETVSKINECNRLLREIEKRRQKAK